MLLTTETEPVRARHGNKVGVGFTGHSHMLDARASFTCITRVTGNALRHPSHSELFHRLPGSL